MATLQEHDSENLERFLHTIEPWGAAYKDATLGFVGVRNGERVDVLYGHLVLPASRLQYLKKQVETASVVGALFHLRELGETYESALRKLATDSLSTPVGRIRILRRPEATASIYFNARKEAQEVGQSRILRLSLLGAQGQEFPYLEYAGWELRAGDAPYESLEELARDVSVENLRPHGASVEVTAHNVAAVDLSRQVLGTQANLGLLLAQGLNVAECSLGYKVIAKNAVTSRARISGSEMSWQEMEGRLVGSKEIAVPEGAFIQCFASYRGQPQHYGWILAPNSFPNPLRLIHDGFDRNLEVLQRYVLDEEHLRRHARDLEAGIANLLFLLGFAVDRLEGRPLEDGPDIIATTPKGNVALIECTSGQINKDGKLGKLVDRAEVIRSRLRASAYENVRVLPVVVTPRPKEAVAELDVAKRQGVLVWTREALSDAIGRTLVPQDADALFEGAWEALNSPESQEMPWAGQ